jgi:Tol biopolymer transport system component
MQCSLLPRDIGLRLALALFLAGSPATAQVNEIVSVDSNGVQANYNVTMPPPDRTISADGRFVVFVTDATNLVPGDTNGTWDIFVRDRLNRTTERVSVDSNGVQGNGISGLFGVSISADGRFVAFESASNNLVPGDTNGSRECFVHDRLTGTTERVALDSNGVQGNAASHYPSISADGRYVAFISGASSLVPGDGNGKWDVFVRDRMTQTIERVSVSTAGVEADSDSYKPAISGDGRFVVFGSTATTLVPGDTNGWEDVFVRDRLLGTTDRVSVATNGAEGNDHSGWGSVSDDGRYVTFWSRASNLVSADTNGSQDDFVRDRLNGTTVRVSVASDGTEADMDSGIPVISGDGRFVVFWSGASTLVPGDTNTMSDVFLHDCVTGTTERLSVDENGNQVAGGGAQSCISLDARYCVFSSGASNLVPGDTNGYVDIFVRDRYASGFTSICDPGLNNVIDCPCGNAPAGRRRGCDNSSFTGGAVLSSSGIAYLALDSLAFTTADERTTATSILVQGDTLLTNGAVFGQGVRCAGGTLRRMYVKIAANGSITAPDLLAGDPTVSSRSASLGTPIQPGQAYLYFVYYRDPVVLGTCPATSTFNCTQTGSVSWWP